MTSNRTCFRTYLVATLICSALSALTFTAAPAQGRDFSANSASGLTHYDSGWASGWFSSENAIVGNMSYGLSYRYDRGSECFFINVSSNWEGVYGPVTLDTPYTRILEGRGLHGFSSLQLTEVTIGEDERWIFNTPVSITLNVDAYLIANEEHTHRSGYLYASAFADGALPIQSSASVTIYEEGHPGELPDWSAHFNAEFLVVAEGHLIPTPGSCTLLGLGALAVARRRR